MVEQPFLLDNFAYFGDGNSARIIQRRKIRKKDGITYWEFFFIPSKRVRDMYKLKDEISPRDNTIRREYPEVYVIELDSNPTHLRILIKRDFNGRKTNLSEEMSDKDLMILNLQKNMGVLELELSEKDRLLRQRTSPEDYIHQASEMVKIARTAAAKQKTGGDGESEEDDDDE